MMYLDAHCDVAYVIDNGLFLMTDGVGEEPSCDENRAGEREKGRPALPAWKATEE